MKKVYNYWMPNSDNHFERLINKRIKNGGPPEYQDDVREEAYKYVTDFNLCIDVGANVGLWAVPLTKKFNKVIAFEPMKEVYKCLELNAENLPIDINRYALGANHTTVDIIYNSENTGSSYVDKTTLGSGSIDVRRLDDMDIPKFGLIKLDCEGYEFEVIQGALKYILKYKPIMVVEQHAKNKLAGQFLESKGAKLLSKVRKDYIFGW